MVERFQYIEIIQSFPEILLSGDILQGGGGGVLVGGRLK